MVLNAAIVTTVIASKSFGVSFLIIIFGFMVYYFNFSANDEVWRRRASDVATTAWLAVVD
jgi:hypothetical protein